MRFYCKASVLLLLAVCQSALIGCVEQPELINQQRLTHVSSVAVMPFEDAPSAYGRNSGTAVCGFITSELAMHKKYRVVERSRLKTVLNEQDLQSTSLMSADTAADIGKLLGVQAVILGSVSQYDMDKTTVYIHVVPVVSKDYKVGATVRMIDVTTGEIIYAHSACGQSGAHFTEAGKFAAQQLLAPLLGA